jgi:hypothetical protein
MGGPNGRLRRDCDTRLMWADVGRCRGAHLTTLTTLTSPPSSHHPHLTTLTSPPRRERHAAATHLTFLLERYSTPLANPGSGLG